MKQGVSQVDLAKEAGITRARVCQLVRLSDLSSKVKILIRKGDELYSIQTPHDFTFFL